MTHQRLGRHDPDALVPRLGREGRQPALVGPHDYAQPEEPRLRGGKGARRRDQALDEAVDVIHRPVAEFDGPLDADVERNVARKPDPDPVGRGGDGVENAPPDAGVNLEEIVPGLTVLGHRIRRVPTGPHGIGIERRARRVDPRTQQLAARRAVAVREVPRIAEHSPNGGDPVEGEQRQDPLDLGVGHLRPRRNVGVHFSQTRHQELPGPLDPDCPRRDGDPPAGTHGDDPVARNDHGLAGQDPITIHRDDGHVDERVGRRLANRRGRRRRRCEREEQQ